VREGFIQNPAYPNDPVPPDAVDPAYDYPHSVGQTIIGGYVYRGRRSGTCAAFTSSLITSDRTQAISRVAFSPLTSTARSLRISRTSPTISSHPVGQFSAAQSGVVRRRRQRRALHRRHLEREHFPDRARPP
jgi:hypothetical protein